MVRLLRFLLFLLSFSGWASWAAAQQLDSIGITTNGTVQAVVRDANTLYVGGQFSQAGYQTGAVALADQTSGFPVASLPRLSGTVYCAVSDGAGGWYVGGNFSITIGSLTFRNLLRVRSSHAVDQTFRANPDGTVQTLALDGTTLFLGGTFNNVGGLARRNLAAVDAGTGLATAWSVPADGTVQSLLLIGTTLHVGGSFTSIGGQPQRYYAQVNRTSGAVAHTVAPNNALYTQAADAQQLYWGGQFSETGYFTGALAWLNGAGDVPDNALPRISGTVYCTVADGTGGWYVGGSFSYTAGTQTLRNLIHVGATRTVDMAFAPNPTSTVQALALDGQTLYVGGNFTNIGGLARQNLAAVETTTGLATNWNPGASSTVTALWLSGTTLHVGGSFTSIGGQPQRYYAQVNRTSGAVAHTVAPNNAVQVLRGSGQNMYIGGQYSETGYYTGSLAWLNGTGDVPDNNLGRYTGAVYCAEPDGTGGWYVGGSFTWSVGTQQWRNLVHLRANFTLDQSFDPNPTSTVQALALDGQTLYVGGNFTNIGGLARQNLAAVNAATGLAVSSWNPSANSTVEALVLSGNNLYLAGSFTQVNGQAQRGLGAVHKSTGAFFANIPELNSTGHALWLDGQSLYVGGSFSQIGGQARSNLAVINTSSNTVTGWNVAVSGTVQGLAADGTTLYVGGTFTQIGGQLRNRLASVDKSSGQVSIWNPSPNNTVEALAVDGLTVYVGGSFTTIAGQARQYAAAVSTTGIGAVTSWQPDPNSGVNVVKRGAAGTLIGGSFSLLHTRSRSSLAALDIVSNAVSGWNPSPSGQVSALAVSGSLVYVGGTFTQIGGQQRQRLAAVDNATGQATAWNPSPNSPVEALAVDGSTVYVGGSFTTIAGQPRRYAAALSTTGTSAVTTWQPEPNGTVNTISRSAAETMLGGSFSMIHDVPRNSAAAVTLTSNAVSGWNPSPSGQVSALAVSGSLVYVGGTFTQIGGQQRQRLAAVDNATGQATAWNPSPNSPVEALAVDGSTVYVGGSFTTIAGQARQYAAAVSTTGIGAVTSWNPQASSTVQQIATTTGAVLLGGSFTFLKAEDRANLFAVDLATGLVSSWAPAPNGRINTLMVTASALFVGGSFSQIGGQPRSNLAALSKTTGTASTWNPSPNAEVAALLLSGTKVYVGGSFSQIGGQARNNLAAVNASGTGTALTWTPNPDGRVIQIKESDNVVYVCGSFNNVSGQARRGVAAINSTTGALLPWNPNPNGTVQDLHVTARQVYLAGSFSRIGNTNRSNIGVVSKATGAVMPWNPGANGTVNDVEVKNNFVFIGGSFTAAGGQTVRNFASLNANTGLNNDWYPSFNSTVQTIYIDNRDGLYVGGSFSTVDGKLTGPYVRYSFPRNYFRPRLEAITPNAGGNTGDVLADIIGSGFSDGTSVRLTKTGANPFLVPDSILVNTDGIRLKANLDLTGRQTGRWNVVVTVPGDTVMTLANAFNVEVGRKAEPWASLIGFNNIRRGQWQTYTVTYGNTSNVNAVAVPLWIATPAHVDFELDHELIAPRSAMLDTISSSVFADSLVHGSVSRMRLTPVIIPLIRPGDVGTLTFRIRTNNGTGNKPMECSVWTSEPLWNDAIGLRRGIAGTAAFGITSNQIDCIMGSVATIAGLFPAAGCLAGLLDNGFRPWIREFLADDPPAYTYADFTKNLANAAFGCTPTGIIYPYTKLGAAVLTTVVLGQGYFTGTGSYEATTACMNWRPKTPPVPTPIRPVNSFDPNDKLGNSGVGGSPYVQSSAPFRYLIRFENYATASAAAQEVQVIDTLDITKLDPSTLQLGYMSFGNRRVEVRRGLKNFSVDVDLRPANNLILRIVATLNETTGVLKWVFTSLDPATMRHTLDPLAGFLPPNVTAPEGEGSVFFTIMPRAGLTTHTAIRNKACIYFDNNAVICTPTWTNNVDNVAPVSSAQPLPAQQVSRSFRVNWSGTDAASGVADYSIYYSVNGRGYKPWLKNTTLTTGIFTGKIDSTYRFYSIARDSAYNEEAVPAQHDAITTISNVQVSAGTVKDTVCVNASPYQLTGFSPAGGTWSGRGVSATGLVTPSVLRPGNNDLVYTVTIGGQTQVAAKTILARPISATPRVLRVGVDSLRSSLDGASYEWRVNNVVIPVTRRTVRITQQGSYTVRVTEYQRCISASSPALTVLSAARAQQQAAVKIYPNPTSQRFSVAGETSAGSQVKIQSVQIVDEVGRIFSETLVRQEKRVTLEAPKQSGVYIVRIFTNQGLVVHKLTVLP